MKIIFLSLAIILATFLLIQPVIMVSGQSRSEIERIDPSAIMRENPNKYRMGDNGALYVKGEYIVTLKNETFDSINNDPKFSDPAQYTPSNIPENNSKVIPALRHEYVVETAKIVNDKVDEYNGTQTSSLSPLAVQGGHVEHVWIHALKGFSVENTEDISVFVNDPDIQSVEPSEVFYPRTQYNPTNILRSELTKAATIALRPDAVEQFSNVDVAVIDSGVVPNHPDLNVFQTVSFAGTFTPGSHGTHVAGTMAARDNLGGVVGVVPGARIWSVQVCPSTTTGCQVSAIVSGLNYIVSNAASIEVVNMSLGPSCGWLCSDPIPSESAKLTAFSNIRSAGVTMTVAAGNDRINTNLQTPCDSTDVICVSAMSDYDGLCGGKMPTYTVTRVGVNYADADDTIAFYSNFGSVVDFMAPGSSILSTELGLSTTALSSIAPYIGNSPQGGYSLHSGTSMAAPFVGGAAALVKMLNPSFTPAQIISSLQTNSIDQSLSCDNASRGGLVSGANARSGENIINLRNY